MHDTHGHFDLFLEQIGELESFDKTLSFNKENINISVEKYLKSHEFFVQAGVDTHNFLQSWKAFGEVEKIYFLIGSHPEIVNEKFDLEKYLSEQQNQLEKYLKEAKKYRIVGIGEIGLDYYYSQDKIIIQTQKDLFESQIKLALKYNLPIQLHIRDAFDDAFEILKKYPQIHGKFMVHCFTGNDKNLQQILDLGGFVAYGGVSTFKNAKDLQLTINKCPIESFVLETDLPYLAPQAVRGKVCLPEFIDYTADFHGEIRSLNKQKIWDYSAQNAKKFFNL